VGKTKKRTSANDAAGISIKMSINNRFRGASRMKIISAKVMVSENRKLQRRAAAAL